MRFDFDDYSGMDNEVSIPLLVSERSQGLLLAAMAYLQQEYAWDETDDFNVIDEAVSNAISEIILEIMADTTPVGAIVAFVGETADIPGKWLICDGATHDNADYPELAAIMPSIWDGTTQFVVPDLRFKFLRGAANDAGHASSGGSNSHALTVAELPVHHHIVPSHSHNILKASTVAGVNTRAAIGSNNAIADQVTSTQPATDTSDTGSGMAFDNQPAFITFHWIIKALP